MTERNSLGEADMYLALGVIEKSFPAQILSFLPEQHERFTTDYDCYQVSMANKPRTIVSP